MYKISKKSNKPKSILKGLDSILAKAVSQPDIKGELILCDLSTKDIGSNLHKAGKAVALIPVDNAGDWIEDNFDDLQIFKNIRICSKSDINKYVLADRLGFEKISYLDAETVKVDFDTAVADAEKFFPLEVASPNDVLDDTKAIFSRSLKVLPGISTPFKTLDSFMRPLEGDTTGIASSAGSGKSTLVSQIVGHAMLRENRKVFWISLEMPMKLAIPRLICSLTKKKLMGLSADQSDIETCPENYLFDDDFDAPYHNLGENLYFYNSVSSITVDQLLQRMDYARRMHGCTVFVIDSMMKCVNEFDNIAVKDFVNRVTDWSRIHSAITFLIAHNKKPQTPYGVDADLIKPKKSDFSGANAYLNLCSNAMMLWRNRTKKEMTKNLLKGIEIIKQLGVDVTLDDNKHYKVNKTNTLLSDSKPEKGNDGKNAISPRQARIHQIEDMITAVKHLPDAYAIIGKVRWGSDEGEEVPFWYDANSFRFREDRILDDVPVYPELLTMPEPGQSKKSIKAEPPKPVIIPDEVQDSLFEINFDAMQETLRREYSEIENIDPPY